MKYLKCNKGSAIAEYIVIIIVVSIIGASIIPSLNIAVKERQEKTVEFYNGTDTITEVE